MSALRSTTTISTFISKLITMPTIASTLWFSWLMPFSSIVWLLMMLVARNGDQGGHKRRYGSDEGNADEITRTLSRSS
jgi:hypothetical protein